MIQNQEMRPAWRGEDEEKKKGDDGGMLGGMMAGLSDRHSKEKIQKLSSTNEALMAALDSAHANTPESNLPPTEYPSMPANTRLPSRANFADSPAANKVAAQNVGMQAAAPPPPQAPPPRAAPAPQAPPGGMQANPQQQNFARSNNPAFNVGGGMPDLSALDEAYRRQGMGG